MSVWADFKFKKNDDMALSALLSVLPQPQINLGLEQTLWSGRFEVSGLSIQVIPFLDMDQGDFENLEGPVTDIV